MKLRGRRLKRLTSATCRSQEKGLGIPACFYRRDIGHRSWGSSAVSAVAALARAGGACRLPEQVLGEPFGTELALDGVNCVCILSRETAAACAIGLGLGLGRGRCLCTPVTPTCISHRVLMLEVSEMSVSTATKPGPGTLYVVLQVSLQTADCSIQYI